MLVLLAGPGSRYYASTVGEIYNGLTPTIYAAPADVGTGDGSSEANAMALIDVCGIVEADDVVGLIPANGAGSYFYPDANTDAVYFQPTNSGTSGHPITFVAKYCALDFPDNPELWSEFRQTNPVFSTTATDLNANRPGIGSGTSGPSFVHWIGGYIDQQFTSNRPSHGVVKIGANAEGVRIARFRFKPVNFNISPSDNVNMIFMDHSVDAVIEDNVFDGGGALGTLVSHNLSVITTYGAQNFTIRRNTFTGSNTAIFVKGTSNGFNYGEITLNKFIDLYLSAVEFCDLHATNPTNVHQNLFVRIGLNGDEGTAIVLDNSSSNARNLNVYQNTIVDPGINDTIGQAVHIEQVSGAYQDFVFRDNVVYFSSGVTRRGFIFGNSGGTTTSDETTSNYNIWHGVDGGITFEDGASTYTSVAAWSAGSGEDANSSTSDPGFAAIGSDDYRRLGADTGSSTAGRRGAYITNSELIGAE